MQSIWTESSSSLNLTIIRWRLKWRRPDPINRIDDIQQHSMEIQWMDAIKENFLMNSNVDPGQAGKQASVEKAAIFEKIPLETMRPYALNVTSLVISRENVFLQLQIVRAINLSAGCIWRHPAQIKKTPKETSHCCAGGSQLQKARKCRSRLSRSMEMQRWRW